MGPQPTHSQSRAATQEAWASGWTPGGGQSQAHARILQLADGAAVPQQRETCKTELTFGSSETGNDGYLLTEQGKGKADNAGRQVQATGDCARGRPETPASRKRPRQEEGRNEWDSSGKSIRMKRLGQNSEGMEEIQIQKVRA